MGLGGRFFAIPVNSKFAILRFKMIILRSKKGISDANIGLFEALNNSFFVISDNKQEKASLYL